MKLGGPNGDFMQTRRTISKIYPPFFFFFKGSYIFLTLQKMSIVLNYNYFLLIDDGRINFRIESMLVGKVVEDILNKRTPTNLNISIYPIRYDNLDEYLNLFMQVGRDYVLIGGICGPSGMGKTSIAEAIYNQIFFTFEGSSFLENVGQNSRKPNGLVQLQEKLLSDILLERNVKVRDVNQGVDMIKENLGCKRVLVMLDDVDDLDQLYALVGDRSRFGLGSKIIITTRKVHLLNVLEVDQVFMAQGLPLPPNIQVIELVYFQTNNLPCHCNI